MEYKRKMFRFLDFVSIVKVVILMFFYHTFITVPLLNQQHNYFL
jgi:hypothetical protein